MIVLAPGTEDPALSGCRLREATSTFPALAGAEYPTWLDGLTRGGLALLAEPLLGLIASRECPGYVLLETLDRVLEPSDAV